MLELVPAMGDFVPAGAPLFSVDARPDEAAVSEIVRLVALGPQRTHDDDPAYGFRVVDIAERSISQPFDDPTTAKQAIDRLHDCLRQLAPRRFPTGRHRDEIRLRRLLAAQEGGARGPEDGRPARARRPSTASCRCSRRGVRRAYDEERDVDAALAVDQQGIGSGEDLVVDGPGAPVEAVTEDRS